MTFDGYQAYLSGYTFLSPIRKEAALGHFGEDLRKERMSRGVDLATISGSTKIVTRYLTALENDQFQVLPGGILSKGIVRGYARVVGLDEHTWVDRFLEASRLQGVTDSDDGWVEFANNVKAARPAGSGQSSMLRWMGLCFLLVLLVGVGWFVYSYMSGRTAGRMSPHAVATATVTAPAVNSAGQ